MRKVLTVALSSLIFVSGILLSQPKVEFINGETHDWGEVKRSSGPLYTEVKIKNAGTETLKIYGVKRGCGCTTAPIDKDELEPGEIATVDVQLKIKKDEGPITKTIEFTTNDPENDRINYYLKADVIVPLTLFPGFINMGNMTVGKEYSGKIVLSNNTKKVIKITEVKNNPPNMKVNLKKGMVLSANSHNPVEVKVTANGSGQFTGKIHIKTDHKEMSELNINVKGMIQ